MISQIMSALLAVIRRSEDAFDLANPYACNVSQPQPFLLHTFFDERSRG